MMAFRMRVHWSEGSFDRGKVGVHLYSAVVGHKLVLHVLLHGGLFRNDVNVCRRFDAAHNRRYQMVGAQQAGI